MDHLTCAGPPLEACRPRAMGLNGPYPGGRVVREASQRRLRSRRPPPGAFLLGLVPCGAQLRLCRKRAWSRDDARVRRCGAQVRHERPPPQLVDPRRCRRLQEEGGVSGHRIRQPQGQRAAHTGREHRRCWRRQTLLRGFPRAPSSAGPRGAHRRRGQAALLPLLGPDMVLRTARPLRQTRPPDGRACAGQGPRQRSPHPVRAVFGRLPVPYALQHEPQATVRGGHRPCVVDTHTHTHKHTQPQLMLRLSGRALSS
mmetsp:Transcript_4811/g.11594  ORF Transcript_4811/g.11594 Transcript_4811/m.11594 type:complete len:256 (+) Transcript_4811:1651-2418(+)